MNSARATAAVAGASGILGRRVVAALRERPGLDIRPILRPVRAAGPEALTADLTRPADCDRVVQACDLVICCAGPAGVLQLPLFAACRTAGRPIFDISGRVAPPGAGQNCAAPAVFSCGVMPGWSELLPRLLLADSPIRAACDVRIDFVGGGPLGPAGIADVVGAAKTEAWRAGQIWEAGAMTAALQRAGWAYFLSREAEALARELAPRSLHVASRVAAGAKLSNPGCSLAVTVSSGPSGKANRLSEIVARGPNAAAFSVAALSICLDAWASDALRPGAIDFQDIPVGTASAEAALAAAGISLSGAGLAALSDYETGTI